MPRPTGGLPRHRSIIAIDAEGSTRLTDPSKGCLRRSMYDLFERSLHAGGLTRPYRDPFLDRGDGVLAMIRPVDRAPKTVLLDTVVPTLGDLLAEHNLNHPDQSFRLRTVVHAGEVTFDGNGCYGETLDVAFRLLEAAPLKRVLKDTDAPMVLVVSDDIHRSVVRHGYEGIDSTAFSRLLLPQTTGPVRSGWVRVVGSSHELSGAHARVARIEDHWHRA